MRTLIGIACAAAACLFVLYYYAWEHTIFDSEFESYESAEASGAVAGGWVPEFLPRSATTIIERHDLDTNERCLTARVPEPDLHSLEIRLLDSGYVSASTSPPAPHRLSPFTTCPFELSDLGVEALLFRKPTPGSIEVEYVALLRGERRLFYWSAFR
ncbi:MAG: hypothetical protein GY937_17525 [bacterium]|nr:hypothetical protein [bacterium]